MKEAKMKDDDIANELLTPTDYMSHKDIQELVQTLQTHQLELEMQNEELHLSRAKLKESQRRYFDLYDMAPIGYCTLSKEGLILEVNFTLASLFGCARHDLINKSIIKFIVKEDQDVYYLCAKKLFQTNLGLTCDLRMIKRDGSVFYAHAAASAEERDPQNSHVMLTINDVTESEKARKKIEQLNVDLKAKVSQQLEELRKKDAILLQQSTLAQMGEMISMIVHQWRQPLNAISGAAIELSLLNMRGDVSGDDISRNSKFIQNMTQKMSQTIDDFMNFNKEEENSLFSLSDSVYKTYEIVEAQCKSKSIKVNVDIDEKLSVFHNSRAIEHSLLNLIINSRDAFDESKKTKNKKIDIYSRESDDAIFLIFKDNASGISKELIGKIFNPYFTTKEEGKGTGLGLYMTKRMIEEVNQSSISVESQDDTTTFTIKFPKSA